MTAILPLMTVPAAAGTTNTGAASNGTGAASSAGSSTSKSSTLSSNQLNQLSNPQLFLQLLVAELQNQDPTNPMNPSQILSQTASLTQMEAINSMVTAVNGEQSASKTAEATSLIGQNVSATVNNATVSGTVSEVTLSASGDPTLVVNGTNVPLAAVTSVGQAPAPSASAGSASGAAATAGAAATSGATATGTGAASTGTATSAGGTSTGTSSTTPTTATSITS